MAYDEGLAQRVRQLLPDAEERRMFGGLTLMIGGNIACGVMAGSLLVRFDPASEAALLDEPHVRPFEMGNRVSRGWLVVEPEGLTRQADLERWVEVGRRYAAGLRPKVAS